MNEKVNVIDWYTKNGKGKYWKASLELMFNNNLKSLMIPCPKCNEEGLAITKWEKGLREKPLYVIHKKGRILYGCFIDCNTKDLRGNISISKKDLSKVISKTKSYVLFSGGKDSLCTAVYLNDIANIVGKQITALHIDTTAGFPEVVDNVKKVCKKIQIPLIIVQPKRDFFELAKKWGIPSFKSRWCCKELKVKPVRDFLSEIPGQKVIFDGIRAAESSKRKSYLPVWYHSTFRCLSISPIFLWNDVKIKSFIKDRRLSEFLNNKFDCSVECWCGAYKKRSDFENLLKVHPEIFNKLVEVEDAQRGRFTYIYEDGKQIPLKQLRDNL